MDIIVFENDGRILRTPARNWVIYKTFDAYDEKGDSYVVNREDCAVIEVEEG